jgi:hypothetical protein
LEKHLCLKHHRKSHHPLQVSVVGFAAWGGKPSVTLLSYSAATSAVKTIITAITKKTRPANVDRRRRSSSQRRSAENIMYVPQ